LEQLLLLIYTKTSRVFATPEEYTVSRSWYKLMEYMNMNKSMSWEV